MANYDALKTPCIHLKKSSENRFPRNDAVFSPDSERTVNEQEIDLAEDLGELECDLDRTMEI